MGHRPDLHRAFAYTFIHSVVLLATSFLPVMMKCHKVADTA